MKVRNPITNRVYNPYSRLIFGLLRIALFFVFIANFRVILDFAYPYLEMTGLSSNGVKAWGGAIVLALLAYTFYQLCVGGLHLLSWNVGPLPSFDKRYFSWYGSRGANNSSYQNIHRIIDYRDSKINHMSREDGVNIYMSTEAFVSRFSSTYQGERMLGLVDSKLNHMSREGGLKYIESLVKE